MDRSTIAPVLDGANVTAGAEQRARRGGGCAPKAMLLEEESE
jgi:hypothetical protein